MKHKKFDCVCNSPSHQVRFWYDPDETDPDVQWFGVDVILNPTRNIFQRCRIALAYIFGVSSPYVAFDEAIVEPDQARELAEFVGEFVEYAGSVK